MRGTIRTVSDREWHFDLARQTKLDGTTAYNFMFERRRKRRSLKANALMWVWLFVVQSDTGNDKNDLHLFFRKRFLGNETRMVFGEEVSEPRSTATLNTAEFTTYMEQIRMWCLEEQQIVLPNPDEPGFDDMMARYDGEG